MLNILIFAMFFAFVNVEVSKEQRAFDFIHSFEKGIISTIRDKSIQQIEVGFILDEDGNPIISGDFNSKTASFCIAKRDDKGSIFNGSRATIQGDLAEVDARSVMELFFQRYDSAIVGTLEGGQPYQSIMPFVVDDQGRPIVLISDLAVHTGNIVMNPTASFHVGWATFNGKLVKVPDVDLKSATKKYTDKFVESKQWADWEDFSFYRLEDKNIGELKFYKLNVKSFYFIGGFGDINYLDIDKYKQCK